MFWNVFTDYYLIWVFWKQYGFTDICYTDGEGGALDGTSITDCCLSFSSIIFQQLHVSKQYSKHSHLFHYPINICKLWNTTRGKISPNTFNEWPRRLHPRTYWTDPSSDLTYGGRGHVAYRSRERNACELRGPPGVKVMDDFHSNYSIIEPVLNVQPLQIGWPRITKWVRYRILL